MFLVTVYDKQARTIDSTTVETWAEVISWSEQYQNHVEINIVNITAWQEVHP